MSFKDKVGRLLDVAIPTFGEKVRYSPKAGGVFTIDGVFDNDFELVDPDTELVISSNIPRVGIRLSDLPKEPEQGDGVSISSVKYRVIDSQEDGQGGATLILHKVR